MTILLVKVSTFAACVVVLLSSSSPVLSATFTTKQEKVIQVENQPFELQCIVTGTQEEIDNIINIEWSRPDPDVSGSEIVIAENDPNRNITVRNSGGVFTSTLRLLQGPPDIQNLRFYLCKVTPPLPGSTTNQHFFPIRVLKAGAVPKAKIHPVEPGQVGESVALNCSVSYNNDNFQAEYSLTLSWKKNGNVLEEKKNLKYELGSHTEEIIFSFVVKRSRDGGDYVCHWNLIDQNSELNSILGNRTVVLPIVPYLNGPAEKEVEDTAGSDVKLTCDVIGYPIRYEWRDDKKSLIEGKNSRYRPEENVLYIDDIDYEDRKAFSCVGIVRNGTITQTIILRVTDPHRVLWPIIGILAEAIVIAAIILISEYYKKTRNEKDGAGTKIETTEQPSTST